MKSKNKVIIKDIVAAMVVVLAITGIGIYAYAKQNKKTNDKVDGILTLNKEFDNKETTLNDVDNLSNDSNKTASLTSSIEDLSNKLSKEETVYVIAGADGRIKNVIVSDWIKNCKNTDKIIDKSELYNIENTKGDETYTINKDNMQVWQTQGNDIYYQGTTDKKLPVDIKVTYSMNGKEMSAEEISGKSGKITIRFDYTNNEKQSIDIDGTKTDMYVPFLMLTGTILDGDNFSNIDISNGKIINDGDNNVVVGYAVPGMNESLDVDYEDFNIPDYVEITADVKDFSLSTTMTLAMDDIFKDIDIVLPENIVSSLNEMADASTKLVDGSNQLYTAMITLLDESGTLIDGIKKIDEGAKKIQSGSKELAGYNTTLSEGATALAENMANLVFGAKTALDGANKVSEGASALTDASGTLETRLGEATIGAGGIVTGTTSILSGATVITDGATTLDAGVDEISNGVDSTYNNLIQTINTNIQIADILEQINVTLGNNTTITTLITSLRTTIGYQQQIAASMTGDGELKAGVLSLKIGTTALVTGSQDILQGVTTLSGGAEQLYAGMQDLSAASTQLKTKLIELSSGASTLSTGLNTLYTGSTQLESGANTLANSSKQIKTGVDALAAGANELSDGTSTLSEGSNAFVSGVTEIKNGADTLSKGMAQFDEDAVQKLINIYDGDVNKVISRLNILGELSRAYNNYSGIADNMDGSVKFIYKTDEIK